MNFDRLHLFTQIVDTGSVSAAARGVHLSQPAASRNLQALEDELGVELFERHGRKLVLSAAGRTFLPRARGLLAALEIARDEVERTQQRGYHDVRIGTVDSIGTYVMPAVLPALRDSFDELGVKLVTSRTASLIERLHDDIDIAVVAWSGPPPSEHATRIARYEMQFYGRADRYPELAEVTDEAHLSRFPIVQIEPKPGQPTLVDEEAPSYALTQSLASVKTLILGGFGVGAMLNYMLDADETAELVFANIPHDPHCALWAVCSPDWRGERADAIADAIVSLVKGRLA